ncbi:MAG: nucleotide exchange factor GrpE [Xanthomonadaceae bacterium]|nr:nucleotide exchange factor GrpE [Xanthomonadaceae bacterium]
MNEQKYNGGAGDGSGRQESSGKPGEVDRDDTGEDPREGHRGEHHGSGSEHERADERRAHSGGDSAESQDRAAGNDAQADAARDPAEEAGRMKEAMLRMRAEMDNREKRLEREMSKARKFALESLMRDFVQVLDSLDQALAAADPAESPGGYEGMELTRKQAVKVLTEHGLEILEPLNQEFDPSWHEAVTIQPTAQQPPDTVVQVLQKGYRIHERLLRPARVIVAKAP